MEYWKCEIKKAAKYVYNQTKKKYLSNNWKIFFDYIIQIITFEWTLLDLQLDRYNAAEHQCLAQPSGRRLFWE